MPRYGRRKKSYGKRRPTRRAAPKRRKRARTKSKKPRVGNFAHVKLIRPISRKPFTNMTRHCYYGKAVVQNRLSQTTMAQAPSEEQGPLPGFQQMQYCTLHLNTPGVFAQLSHQEPARCNWTWQDNASVVPWPNDHVQHFLHDPSGVNPNPAFLPGFFDQPTRAGYQYLNHTCVQYTLTVTATPMPSEVEKYGWEEYDSPAGDPPVRQYNSRTVDNQPGVLFISKHSQSTGTNPSGLSNTATLQELYKRPFTKYRKFKGGSTTQGINTPGGHATHGTAVVNGGANQSASVSMTWKPTRMHGLSNLKDNQQMRVQTSVPTDAGNPLTTTEMLNPREMDAITFGIVPEFQAGAAGTGDVLNDDWVPQACGRVMLTMKIEAVYRHMEPNLLGSNLPQGLGEDGMDEGYATQG